MGRVMSGMLAGAAAALTLSACGGHSAVLDRRAPVTTGVASPASTTAAGVDVAALWEKAASRCSDPQVGDTPPGDPHGFGVEAAWPTDEAVQRTVDSLRPGGDESFTLDRLVDLRAALLTVRHRMADTTIHGGREVELAPGYGVGAQPSIDSTRDELNDFARDWRLDAEFITGEINSGVEATPTGDTADAMKEVPETRKAACR